MFKNQLFSTKISPERLKKVFHIRNISQRETIPNLPVLDDNGVFHQFNPTFEEQFFDLKVLDLVSGSYFGKIKNRNEDFYFPFINFIYQKCYSVGKVFLYAQPIENDIHNLASSMKKLELFFWVNNNLKGYDIQRFVVTEIEYIFSVCQSLYDLLQSIIYSIWENITLKDQSIQKKNLIKDSFSKMLFELKKGENFGLPQNIIDFYYHEESFFKKMKDFRNAVHHKGFTPSHTIYITPKGFGVSHELQHFSRFEVWKEETFENKCIAPLKPIMAFVIKNTLEAMQNFKEIIEKIISFPDDIAPNYSVFLRRLHLDILDRLDSYINNDVWYDTSL
ncbi:MAG: hypothetical protein H7A34_07575 [bacterium]|nr:hypothetical protein [bacterium]